MLYKKMIMVGLTLVCSILIHTSGVTYAQQRPFATDAQKYNNGYEDGLKNSQRDSQGLSDHGCDATVPAGHTIVYQKGYSVGYSKGPCGSSSTSSAPTSPVPVPGLIFPP